MSTSFLLFSHVPLIQIITNHIIQSGGKRLRPLVVLLATQAYAYNQNTENYELATVIEFIYTTATLLHDNVIDQSDQYHDQ
ncbi:polyprenyl synthetase family protein [Coxiella endosymbiont of Rhipicephalus microplus]|uniref:polyprenyl synthetase family protein n=1 Tax=Coxiella endosymbiont of Rhipicephalus microplus TaxID=1656186 RepID=UPI000CAF3081|nr:polyprenyl synthetase family protein [Coxiella endosymbiont of Rhipicephalus microplus]PMB54768.1 Octaprenyl diphosphate synthase/Dimethylallyltransferase [Coxiella-like endosymbiont]